MSGKHGGVQKLLQQKLGHDIPYVHCLNHQLHLVVVQAMSAETDVVDFFHVCNPLYKFCKKLTVAVNYKGMHLKRLQKQRWMGHHATVSVILKSFNDLISLLTEIDTARAFGTEVQMVAVGLLLKMTEPSFFIAKMAHSSCPAGSTKQASSEKGCRLDDRFKYCG